MVKPSLSAQPSEKLIPPAAGDGLLGSYFDSADFTDLIETRVDRRLHFPERFAEVGVDWGDRPQGTKVSPDDSWSVRWTGHVFLPKPGRWTFVTESDDGVRLWVGGRQVIDNWTRHPLTRDLASLELAKGWAPIEVEYCQAGELFENNRAAIRLLFKGPGQTEVVVPQSHLRSALLEASDIGRVRNPGSTTLTHRTGRYVLEASGVDIQGKSDSFHYAHTAVQGDASIIARVVAVGDTHPHAKGGVMFRASRDADAANVVMELKAKQGSEFQYREVMGGSTIVGARLRAEQINPPYWVRLDRTGDRFTGYLSRDGKEWELQQTAEVAMPEVVYVGLSSTSHDNRKLTTAVFEQVSISDSPRQFSTGCGGSGVKGFLPLLSPQTFDPLTDDGKDPAGFYRDGDEFYTFRGDRFDIDAAATGPGFDEDEGKPADSDDLVFRFTPDGCLHILGNPNRGQQEPFGYLSTEDNYRNYHLTLDYRWGVEKFAPRRNAKRDSGLLYHVVGPDVVWTTDVETQIQEGDTGDFYFLGEAPLPGRHTLGSSEGTVAVGARSNRYQPGGELIDTKDGLTKSITVDHKREWNRVEVIVEQDNVTAMVNGRVVNRASNLRRTEGDRLIPLTEGKIALQAEGAEVFYRNVRLKPTHAVGGQGNFRLLVFQEGAEASGRREVALKAAEAIRSLGASQGFEVIVADASDGVFTDEGLRPYAAVVWSATAGDVLESSEQTAFRRYIEAGGGFVGIGAVAATESDWPWFRNLVGTTGSGQSEATLATVRIDAEAINRSGGVQLMHPAVDSLPSEWRRVDRWCDFAINPRARANVLLTLDEKDGHPVSWWHDVNGGRSFYTGLGATPKAYLEPLYLTHLLGGIEYAAGVSRVPPRDALVLFDGRSTEAFELADGRFPGSWQIDDEGNLENHPNSENLYTKKRFGDCRLHLEFKVPATKPGTGEQQRGNSGLYLHSSYELQILDSYCDVGFDDRHLGAIYGVKAAEANAALPAEVWQVYDVDFTAPRYSEAGAKTANARITAYLNGVLIHDDVEVPGATRGGEPEEAGPRPFFLQDHDRNSRLKFRNIWVQVKESD